MKASDKESQVETGKAPSFPSMARVMQKSDKGKGLPRFVTPFFRNQRSIDQDILNALTCLQKEQEASLKQITQQQALIHAMQEQLLAAQQSLSVLRDRMSELESGNQEQMTAMLRTLENSRSGAGLQNTQASPQ